MTSRPGEAIAPPHLAHRAAHAGEELGRFDLLRVRAGGVLVRAVPAAAAAGDAGQPGLRRAAVRSGHAADDPGAVHQHGRPASSPPTSSTRSSSRPISDIVKGARGEVVSLGFVISLWAGSSAISAFVDSIVEAHDQTPLRHPVRQRFYALGLYVVMLVGRDRDGTVHRAGTAKDRRVPSRQLGQRAGTTATTRCCSLGLVVAMNVLYRVSLPEPLPSHRLLTRLGAGDRGVPDRHVRAAGVSDVDHQHRLHLRRACDADRVPVVRVLPRLLDHAGRRTERRDPRGVACAGHPREAVPVVVGGEGPSHGMAPAARSPAALPAATTTDGDATS